MPVVGLVIALSACGGGSALESVEGMTPSLAACITDEVGGRIDDDRLVQLVGESVDPNLEEFDIMFGAYANCADRL